VAEAVLGVLGSKGSDGLSDGLFQRKHVAGLVAAQQISQFRARSLDQISDTIDFVSRQGCPSRQHRRAEVADTAPVSR